MNRIKNIIFDFGDVFINLDKTATTRHFSSLGISHLKTSFLELNQTYEKGKISTEDFINTYLDTYPQLTKASFIQAWNSILKDLPLYRLDFLKHLKDLGEYRIFLLSNTNQLHIDWVRKNVACYEEFKSCFEVFYLSYEMGLRKPEPYIFEKVLKQNNLMATQSLFIDDTQEHILSARTLGIQTWHLDPESDDVINLKTKLKDLK